MEETMTNNDVIVNENTTEVAEVATFTEADVTAANNQGKFTGFVTGCAATIGADLLYRFAIRPLVKKAAKKFAEMKTAKKAAKVKTNDVEKVENKETEESNE